MFIHGHMYVCMYVCMYKCVYVCIYVCMYVSMYVCMNACMNVYLLSYFSFQPVLHDWCKKPWYVLSCMWDDAYKRTLAANRKE